MISINEKNLLYVSLAGCGKSKKLITHAKEAMGEGKNILYLSFSKEIREEVIKKHGLPKSLVHTFHSLAFKELDDSGCFKSICNDFNPDEVNDYLEFHNSKSINLTKKSLSMLVSWWCINHTISRFINLDYIFVDELQDLNREMIRMLKILYKMNKGVKIIAAGDPYQTIYLHLNDGKMNKNFKKFSNWFGATDVIELNKSYRSSASIQRFVNGFYKKHYKDKRFFNLDFYAPEGYQEDVFIHCIQHKRNLSDEINNIIKLYPDKEITILGRVNKEIENLNLINDDKYKIQLSTIHKYKGGESDIIILINTIFNDKLETLEDKNVMNVAITRAKEKLHIVSSFPRKNITSKFIKGSYTLINKQSSSKKLYIKNIPLEKTHLTKNKVIKSIIDSIELQMTYQDACFIPFEKQTLKKNSPFKTDSQIAIKNFNFVLHRHNRLLTFNFHNLNPLKNQSFTDSKILRYVEEVQNEYFSWNCDDEDINKQSIKRLDLALYFKSPSKEILNTIELFFKLSVCKDSNNKVKLIEDEAGARTLYLNSFTKKQKGGKIKRYRGIRAYFPYNKKNENKLHDGEDLLKVELYRVKQSNSDNRKGDLCLSFIKLKDITKNDNLKDLFYDWLYYEFPFLKEKPVKNVKLLKKRYNINTFEEIKFIINKGDIKIRDKKNLFYILFDLIKEDEKTIVEDIFKIKKK